MRLAFSEQGYGYRMCHVVLCCALLCCAELCQLLHFVEWTVYA